MTDTGLPIGSPTTIVMNSEGIVNHKAVVSEPLEDKSIKCIDCSQEFTWTAGEQTFFRDKQLQNPPKRCKECKKAKNRRLEAIELAKTTGKRQRIEVRAECARCSLVTTVPFYPCQGRPVYCRDCFAQMAAVSPSN
jgi:CxxC-x17-CxxC domain-containing protein